MIREFARILTKVKLTREDLSALFDIASNMQEKPVLRDIAELATEWSSEDEEWNSAVVSLMFLFHAFMEGNSAKRLPYRDMPKNSNYQDMMTCLEVFLGDYTTRRAAYWKAMLNTLIEMVNSSPSEDNWIDFWQTVYQERSVPTGYGWLIHYAIDLPGLGKYVEVIHIVSLLYEASAY